MSTVTIDMTSDQTIAASISAMPSSARDQLARVLRDAESADNATSILDSIRETLAEQHPGKTAVGVLFVTMNWDNGDYLHEDGTVVFDDGTTENVDFAIADELTDEYGCVHAGYTLAVDLRTNELDADDYRDGDIHTVFGVAKPPADVSPADAALLGSILHGDRESGLGHYRVDRFVTVTSDGTEHDGTEHKVAVLVSDTPGLLDFVCLTCSLVGFATNGNTTDDAVRRWHER